MPAFFLLPHVSRASVNVFLQGNPRTTSLLAVAKENGLDLEFVETKPTEASAEYLKLNKLGKVPTFEGADGYVLSEAIAIAVYCKFPPPRFLPTPPRQRMRHIYTVIPV